MFSSFFFFPLHGSLFLVSKESFSCCQILLPLNVFLGVFFN